MRWLFLVLMVGCRLPDYVETEVYTQQGDGRFDRPVSDMQEETYGFGFTTGWLVGANYEAMRNLAALDVSKGGQLTMRDHHVASGPVEVHVDGGPGEITVENDSAIPVEIASIPETWEDAKRFIAWAGGLLILAGAAFLLAKAGLRVPWFSTNGRDGERGGKARRDGQQKNGDSR